MAEKPMRLTASGSDPHPIYVLASHVSMFWPSDGGTVICAAGQRVGVRETVEELVALLDAV